MSGPQLLFDAVARKTALGDGYLAHAAHQSMTVYLNDWEAAARRLDRQIRLLRSCRDDRRAKGFAAPGSDTESGKRL